MCNCSHCAIQLPESSIRLDRMNVATVQLYPLCIVARYVGQPVSVPQGTIHALTGVPAAYQTLWLEKHVRRLDARILSTDTPLHHADQLVSYTLATMPKLPKMANKLSCFLSSAQITFASNSAVCILTVRMLAIEVHCLNLHFFVGLASIFASVCGAPCTS